MDKILVFTRYDKWKSIYSTKDEQKEFGWEGLFNDAFGYNYKILRCSEITGKSVLEIKQNFEEGCIFLVYDQITLEELKPLLSDCNNYFALVHDEGNYKDYLAKASNCTMKSGNHIQEDRYHYYPVFEILKDSMGEKGKRIFSHCLRPILDKILYVLNECLKPSNNSDKFDQVWDELSSIPELTPFLSVFDEKCGADTKHTLKVYIDNLKTLRNQLLGYALSQK